MMNTYDAIVVGAGPGGALAARTLAKKGRSVLLLERDKLPRHKACGGGLTGNIRKSLDFDYQHLVENRISKTLFVFRGNKSIELHPRGLNVEMIQRHTFDEFLAKKAVEAGAELRDETPLRHLTSENGHRVVETTKGSFCARVVIAADGAASPTARQAGLRREACLGIAMDADVVVPDEEFLAWKDTAIFDFGIVPRGYGWSFPKGKFFSIGVGTIDRRFPTVRQHLHDFMARYPCFTHSQSTQVRAAPLPFWTHHEPLADKGVFLVGDAAGLVDPLSGEGISYAMRSGRIAGEFAEQKLAGDARAEEGYSAEIERAISRGFHFAHRLSDIFFHYPRLCYTVGVRSQVANDIFARLISGEIDYVQLYDELGRSWPGRIYKALKPLLRLMK